MVNSKKMSKSSIAVIVLSILLVLSLILGFTGAWFTDKKEDSSSEMSFGTVKLAELTGLDGISVTNTVDTANTNLMPGSTITGTVNVKNEGNAAVWLRYKVTFSGEGSAFIKDDKGNDLATEYVYPAAALAGGAPTTISIKAKVPELTANTAQEKTVTITVVVEALQQANTAETNAAATWEGKTIVAL